LRSDAFPDFPLLGERTNVRADNIRVRKSNSLVNRKNCVRRLIRPNVCSPNRYGTRLRPGLSRHHFKDLSIALTAFNRAIGSHCRLMKLAPSFFDTAVVHRLKKEREEYLARQRICELALNKIYGTTSTKPDADTNWDPVPPSPPRIRRAVEYELVQCELWIAIGHHHFARFQQSRPHAVLDFSQIARLLTVSINLRCLAGGMTPL
jgi:hypothetical protein